MSRPKKGCETGDKTMEGYKTFKELNAEERLELKQRMVVEMNDEKGEGTSYGELAWANETITDEMLEKRYGDVMFTDEDFSATCYE